LIEFDKIFIIISVIINFQQFHVGIDNLNHLILVIKNWCNDAHFVCEGVKENSLDHFVTRDNTLIKEHMKFIEEQGLYKEGQLILAMLLKYHVRKD
jgi:hypothetical protein